MFLKGYEIVEVVVGDVCVNDVRKSCFFEFEFRGRDVRRKFGCWNVYVFNVYVFFCVCFCF